MPQLKLKSRHKAIRNYYAPKYILDLIARVITVSLKTVEVVDRLPDL